jgi:nucleoside phosphorylase
LAVVVATAAEAAPLEALLSEARRLPSARGRIVVGDFAGQAIALIETGSGAKSVRRTLEEAFEVLQIGRMLLAGVCGGVNPGLESGRSFLPERVQDEREELWIDVDSSLRQGMAEALEDILSQGVLASAGRVLGREEKRWLRARCPDVQAVDMEAMEFGRVASERDMAWAVLKTVADPFDFDLPGDLAALENSPGLRKLVGEAASENARIVEKAIRALSGNSDC